MNAIAVVVALGATAALLLNPRLAGARTWRATVTPLASIIGSGFLVLGPILGRAYGELAVAVMAGLCLAAYALGGAIRYSIARIDALGGEHSLPAFAARLNTASSAALAFAYVVSVTYYLNLFGAFAVALTPRSDVTAGRIVTSAILVFIAYFGGRHGLALLEKLEQGAVSVKLSIIAGLIAGLTFYAVEIVGSNTAPTRIIPDLGLEALFVAFGLVITVQGFETSRYLGAEYDAATRIRSMRYAQWLASAIYVVYIGLIGLSIPTDSIGTGETAVIQMTAVVAPILPALLVVAALAAQFSAAVADTSGCGGLAEELSNGKMRPEVAYGLVAIGGLALTWTADIYQIISYASRAFALYYALQCAVATVLAAQHADAKRPLRVAGLALLTLAAVAMAAFGVPAE
ncbi:MAG: hypothetical protein GKS06_02080 [Acidobacteria bacterium]|nr:hypothetical protein [Acidobacteriota bacterium]